jgi:hypothetical protein
LSKWTVVQFEKIESYQGIALAMPPKARVFYGYSRWDSPRVGSGG